MKIEKTIKARGFPISSKHYEYAHEKASKEEKQRYPTGYKKLKGKDISAGRKHVLLGKNTRSGKIEVSKIVPKRLRKEVAYHEHIENKEIKNLQKAERGKHTADKVKKERKATGKLSRMHKGY